MIRCDTCNCPMPDLPPSVPETVRVRCIECCELTAPKPTKTIEQIAAEFRAGCKGAKSPNLKG